MKATQQIRLSELIAGYESELAAYGLGYAMRLRLLQRAGTIILKHEQQGKKYLDGKIISDYFREIAGRLYAGNISKNYCRMLHREVNRVLHYAETGDVRIPNPQRGARQSLTPKYERVADGYLMSDMHPNTHNDARWVTHMYFSWLNENGFSDLSRVGVEQIQKFLLDCSTKMSMNSIHNVKLHLMKLYSYLYNEGLSKSSYRIGHTAAPSSSGG